MTPQQTGNRLDEQQRAFLGGQAAGIHHIGRLSEGKKRSTLAKQYVAERIMVCGNNFKRDAASPKARYQLKIPSRLLHRSYQRWASTT